MFAPHAGDFGLEDLTYHVGKLPEAAGFGSGRGRDGSLGKLNGATQELDAGVVVGNQVFESEYEPGHVAALADVAERFEVGFHAG
jgi:hypothetical protein